MMAIVSVAVFLVIGIAIGFAGSMLFPQSNKLLSILLGAVGSIGLSWVAKLLGFGAGFLSFSLWGIIAAIVGACLLTAIYGVIAKRIA